MLRLKRPPVRRFKRPYAEREFPTMLVDPYEAVNFQPLMDEIEEFVLGALEDYDLEISSVTVEYEFRGDYGPAFVVRFGRVK